MAALVIVINGYLLLDFFMAKVDGVLFGFLICVGTALYVVFIFLSCITWRCPFFYLVQLSNHQEVCFHWNLRDLKKYHNHSVNCLTNFKEGYSPNGSSFLQEASFYLLCMGDVSVQIYEKGESFLKCISSHARGTKIKVFLYSNS